MKLRDIFEQLEDGELRQMALAGSQASGILERDFRKVISSVNLGLNEIYKRFTLQTKTLIVQQCEGISTYILHPDYAETNTASTKPHKYIKDSPYQPFTDADEVLKIDAVFDEKGERYFLNDDEQVYSLFTPSYNSIQVPIVDSANCMSVQYRCGHPKLQYSGEGVLDQEVNITSTHLASLLLFIGGRYLSSQGNQEAMTEGVHMLSRFELSLMQIKQDNLHNVPSVSNRRIEKQGWV